VEEAGHAWALLDPSSALLVRAAVPLVRAAACPSWAQAPCPTSAQDPPSLASTQTVVASHPSDRPVPWRDLPCSLSLGPVASSRVVPSRSALAGDGTRRQRPILEEEPAHGWAALQWQSYSSLCTRLATSVASRSTWYECALSNPQRHALSVAASERTICVSMEQAEGTRETAQQARWRVGRHYSWMP
jgi:hypothetical protein